MSPLALVVDDDPDFLALATSAFRKLGVSVEAFETPEPFLKRLKQGGVSICMIDLHIGDRTVGYALIQAIRSVLGDELPLFVASSTSDRASIAHALEIGASDFIAKPLDFEILGAKLRHYVSSQAVRRHVLEPRKVPIDEQSARIGFESRIVSVDELGLTIKTRSLLRKGTTIRLQGPQIQAICGAPEADVFVELTEFDPDSRLYSAYVEFDAANDPLTDHVRRWLSAKTG